MDIAKGTPFYKGYMELYGVMKDGFSADVNERLNGESFWGHQMERLREITNESSEENSLLCKIALGYITVLEDSGKEDFTIPEKEIQKSWLGLRSILWSAFVENAESDAVDEELKSFAGTNRLAKEWVKEIIPFLYDHYLERDRKRNIDKLLHRYCA